MGRRNKNITNKRDKNKKGTEENKIIKHPT
jgi:hypothetical protein